MAVQGKENVLAYAAKKQDICDKLKAMMVEQLCLEMDPNFITNDQPLFGRGLEMDSIDSLELSVGIYKLFQISLTDDDKDVLTNVNAMADYVIANMADSSQNSAVELSGGMDLG